jgi:chromosome partitioning protein
MPSHVFISYSTEDSYQVDRLVEALGAEGLTIWRDQNALRLGQEFWNEIENAIKNAGCLLVLVSQNSINNENVIREINIAIENSVPIVPLLRNKKMHEVGDYWISKISNIHSREFSAITAKVISDVVKAVKLYAFRRCQTTAMFNMKGGVGKSTIAAHLASRLSVFKKKSVLLVDLDPQQNLSEIFLTRNELLKLQELHRSIIGLFEPMKANTVGNDYVFDVSLNRADAYRKMIPLIPFPLNKSKLFAEVGFDNDTRFDIIVSQFEAIKYTELGLDTRNLAIENFSWSIQTLKKFYDYVIIDCNPSASLLTRCALRSCDRILAPVRPDNTARRGLIFIKRALEEFYLLPRKPIYVLFNFVRPNFRAERVFIDGLRNSKPEDPMYFLRNGGR